MRIRIIGAGIAGLATAFEFARRGCAIEIFERNAAIGKGCSWYAGGMLAPWCEMESAEPLVGEWGQESLAFWQAEFFGTVSHGSLVLAPSRDEPDLKRFARRTSEFEWLDDQALALLEPDLAGRFGKALFFANEAHLNPRDAALHLQNRLIAEFSVQFHFNTEIDDRDFESSEYDWTVDCRGYAARGELPDFRGVKGEMLVLKTSDVHLARPVRLLHPRFPVYIVPRDNGEFMVGATMIETTESSRITARSMVELLNAAYTVHPAFGEAEIIETGADLRPSFVDNLPRIHRSGARVLRVNGLYRHGFLLAPALARRAADVALSGARFPEIMDAA